MSKRIEKSNEALLYHFFLALLFPLAATTTTASILSFLSPQAHRIVWVPILATSLIIPLGFSAWYLFDKVLKLSHLELGLNGERIVADFLKPLESEGWKLFHDVPAQSNGREFNLDHVAVGPEGVALIETKTRSKGKVIDDRKDYVVTFDGKRLIWPWGSSTSELVQLKRQREWLEAWITERIGITVSVSPILAIPGWWTETTAAGARTRVTNHKSICKAVKGSGMKSLDSETIDLLSRQLESLCRIEA